MPFPIAAAIAAGASLAGSGYNAISQGKLNNKTMAYNERMYAQQRKDALTDQAFQNEYNSPAAQMARLKAAGLNPNLVYGHGATTESTIARSSSPQGWSPNAPQIDTGPAQAGLFQAYDLEMKRTQIDGLRKAMEVAEQERLLKQAQIAATLQTTSSTEVRTRTEEFNLQLLEKLENQTIEGARLGNIKTASEITKIGADTQFTLNSDDRAAALTKNTIAHSVEEIINLRAQRALTHAQTEKTGVEIGKVRADIDHSREMIKHSEVQRALMELDRQLKAKGVQPHDPAYIRAIDQIFRSGGVVGTPQEFTQKVNKITKSLIYKMSRR